MLHNNMYGRSLFWLFTHLNIQEKVWKDKTQIDNNGCPEDRCGGEGIRKVIRREGMKIFRFLRIYISKLFQVSTKSMCYLCNLK